MTIIGWFSDEHLYCLVIFGRTVRVFDRCYHLQHAVVVDGQLHVLNMTHLSETIATPVQSSDDTVAYCTECQGHGWTPRIPCDDVMDDTVRSRGPHQKCSEPSLTPEQQRVWDTVRDLPGVRIRVTHVN